MIYSIKIQSREEFKLLKKRLENMRSEYLFLKDEPIVVRGIQKAVHTFKIVRETRGFEFVELVNQFSKELDTLSTLISQILKERDLKAEVSRLEDFESSRFVGIKNALSYQHPDYKPMIIKRNNNNVEKIEKIKSINDVVYSPVAITKKKIESPENEQQTSKKLTISELSEEFTVSYVSPTKSYSYASEDEIKKYNNDLDNKLKKSLYDYKERLEIKKSEMIYEKERKEAEIRNIKERKLLLACKWNKFTQQLLSRLHKKYRDKAKNFFKNECIVSGCVRRQLKVREKRDKFLSEIINNMIEKVGDECSRREVLGIEINTIKSNSIYETCQPKYIVL